jgi:hypothetical protein
MLITLGSTSIIFIDASDMVCRNTSTGRGVLQATAFVSSSASTFLFLFYGETSGKKSILLTKDRYFSWVGSLAMHSFSIRQATTLESMRRMHL